MAPGRNGGTRLTHPSRNSAIIWAVASFLALLYFVTSVLVVVNSFVWTATFPSSWYTLQKVIYWPFQPYWDLMASLLGGPEITYQTYALVSRSPFLVAPVVVWAAALRHFVLRRARIRKGNRPVVS